MLVKVLIAVFAVAFSVGIIYFFSKEFFSIYSCSDSVEKIVAQSLVPDRVMRILNKNRQTDYVFVIFDIYQFKFFNDTHGYEEGNRILGVIASTIAKFVEKKEFSSKINADNFVLLLKYKSDEETEKRIYNMFKLINTIFISQTENYQFLLNAGIYKIPPDEEINYNNILDKAKVARDVIKGGSKSNVIFFSDEMYQKVKEEQELTNDLHTALENGELVVYYQPKFSFLENRVVGAEALIRWNHPKKGIIYPDKFIPISEKNGSIVNIDYYIFDRVCRQIRKWLDNGIDPVFVSVNMSKIHFKDDNFITEIYSIFKKYDIPSKYIELEITESTAFDNVYKLLDIMKNLQRIGFKISMDDFGAGYSSLGLLKDLPVDVIKLDCSFLRSSLENKKTKIVVEKIVELARDLDIEVIAEGVETLEQADFLKSIGCNLAQGFYYAKPIPLSEFESYIGATT